MAGYTIVSCMYWLYIVPCTIFNIHNWKNKIYTMWCKSRKLGTSHNMLARRSWKTFVKFCLISSIFFLLSNFKSCYLFICKTHKIFHLCQAFSVEVIWRPFPIGHLSACQQEWRVGAPFEIPEVVDGPPEHRSQWPKILRSSDFLVRPHNLWLSDSEIGGKMGVIFFFRKSLNCIEALSIVS